MALELHIARITTGDEYLSVVVHYFSRWMYVNVIRSIISATIIRCLDTHFALFHVSDGLRTVASHADVLRGCVTRSCPTNVR